VPEKLHERTPLIIGSKDDVALVESFVQQKSQKLKMKEHNGSLTRTAVNETSGLCNFSFKIRWHYLLT